ncbi:hypothetical protein V474_17755 [Novosphingobium barchaimii LL02]|uniref:Lipoprotein n=1 Tax=Novosphingobium barchaimii LL02 TaxID=1114963 RepID=A0A0J7XSS4_9SPHN|nr:hypothetical protein [Novosphingobium barchaimii]KMS54916.1 hypothetical protein V474_17755 [Novosphingobium barchaimii LL02]
MKSITTSRLAMIAIASASLGLAACNSPQQEATEKAADAVEAQSDAAADAMEDQAAMTSGTPSEALENQADAVENAGDAKSDAMKDAASKQN